MPHGMGAGRAPMTTGWPTIVGNMRGLPKKSLGQHWLEDRSILEDICAAAALQPTDTVLEIGPGPGTLTELLVQKAGQVIAIELDEQLARQLPARVRAENLQVISQDILQFDLGQLPAGYKVVANIPYYLTGKLLQLLSEVTNYPSTAVLLIQKEVAERAAAAPGAMSILAVTLQFYWEVNLGAVVPARLFTPPPKVDSQLLILRRRTEPLFEGLEPRDFFRLTKLGFAHPRKTLLNNLSAGLHLSRDETLSICERASLDSRRRPQTLRLDEWYQLYQAVHA
jgi:16S rRNA (adenine1518-N6/adenine1519-N6)-dimethyltransferase